MTAGTRQHTARSEDETLAIAARLAHRLQPGVVVALEGQLGAGKTAFVRGLVQGLGGSSSQVSSPTFVIAQEYETERAPFVHIDAYRLAGADELETIGWDELIENGDAIVAVEWAERIAPALPADAVRISLQHVPNEPSHREIAVTGAGVESAVRPCPICKTPTPADSAYAPFCSQRCKRADLGRWLTGRYTISRHLNHRDIESQD